MEKNIIKKSGRIVCIALALIIALSAPNAVYASAASTEKDETVYVNLDTEGKIRETIVSDWLHSDGSTTQIPDKSNLKNIENVKSNESPIKNGDDLTWVLNNNGSSGSNIYYRGTTDKKPPLNVILTYYLNNQQVSAKEITGKSGKVKIKIQIQNTERHDVVVNGKSVEMYTPMTAVLVAALPTKTFKNVQLSDGKLFSDGNTQMVTFLTMPGMNKSLNLKGYDIKELNDLDFPEELEITADAKDFELDSIAISATPELVGMDKLKDSDDIDEMRSNLTKLKNMQDDIEKADPNKDIRALFTNPNKTVAARLLIDDVFDFYDMDKMMFDILPDYVTDKNIALYDKVTSDLDQADIKYLLDNKVIRGVNDRLTDANIQKSKTLVKDYDDIQTFDMRKLDDVIEVLDDYDKMYDKLDDTMDAAKKALKRVGSSKSSMETLEKISSSNAIQGGVLSLTNDLSALVKTLSMYGITDTSSVSEESIKAILIPIIQGQVNSKATALMKQLLTVPGLYNKTDDSISIAILFKALNSSKDFEQLKKDPNAQQIIKKLQAELIKDSNARIPRLMLMGIISDSTPDLVEKIASQLASQIYKVLGSASSLQAGMAKEKITTGDISDVVGTFRYVAPTIKDLKKNMDKIDDDDLQDAMDRAQDILLDDDNMHYMTNWAHKIRNMKTDLDDNSENVGIMKDLLKQYDDPKIKAFKDHTAKLLNDMDETRPVIESLKDRLDESAMNASLHRSPRTVSQLLKIKDDIMNNRNIMETMRLATSPETVSLFKSTFEKLDEVKEDDVVNDYMKKIDDADDLICRKDEFVKLSDEYNIFTDAADGADTKLKFVMKTDEIKKPDEVAQTVDTTKEKQTFFSWFKTAFQNAANKISHIF